MSRAMVCSAVLTVLPPGVFMTTMPLRVAAATSMLSTPTPARTMARSLPGFSSSAAVMCVLAADDDAVGGADRVLQVVALEFLAVVELEAGLAQQIQTSGR